MSDISPIATSESFRSLDQAAYLRRLLDEAIDLVLEPYPMDILGADHAATREAWLSRFRGRGEAVRDRGDVAHWWAHRFVRAARAMADFRWKSALDGLQADTELRRRALAVFRLALREAKGQTAVERRETPQAEREQGSKAVIESRSELWQLLANTLVYDSTTFAEMREAFRWVAAALTPEVTTVAPLEPAGKEQPRTAEDTLVSELGSRGDAPSEAAVESGEQSAQGNQGTRDAGAPPTIVPGPYYVEAAQVIGPPGWDCSGEPLRDDLRGLLELGKRTIATIRNYESGAEQADGPASRSEYADFLPWRATCEAVSALRQKVLGSFVSRADPDCEAIQFPQLTSQENAALVRLRPAVKALASWVGVQPWVNAAEPLPRPALVALCAAIDLLDQTLCKVPGPIEGRPPSPIAARPTLPDRPVKGAAAAVQGEKGTNTRWQDWALGIEHGQGSWHLFHKMQGELRPHRKVRVASGYQEKLLRGLVAGGGFLARMDAIKLWNKHPSPSDISDILKRVKTEISLIRNLIRAAMGGAVKAGNPLRWDRHQKGWRLSFPIGAACQEDGNRCGGESRLRFRASERFSAEEWMDSREEV